MRGIMAEEISGEKIRRMLRLKTGTTDVLDNRESSQLEFKETFNLGSRAKYARTMAGFANNKGGYIVFGVAPAPHHLTGLNVSNFESCDPAKLTEFLNSNFSPQIDWEMRSITIFEKKIGYIYTHEAAEKPIVAVATNGDDIKEGSVYFRYKGQSTAIKYPELRSIIDDRVARERQAWFQHIRTIGRAGATNVGILDTIHGKLYGGGPPFLIDEQLLRKLKFIRRGRFSESEGAATLRLVGEVQAVGGVEKEVPVSVGIHADDIITAYLAQRSLEPPQAASYVRETAYQSTPYVPLHYFVRLAGLSVDQAGDLIKATKSTAPSQIKRLLRRLTRNILVTPMGSIADLKTQLKDLSKESLASALSTAKTEMEKRGWMLAALRQNPGALRALVPGIPLGRLCEAITHLSPKDLGQQRSEVLELLLFVFVDHFGTMSAAERTMFRKAVAFCDENLSR